MKKQRKPQSTITRKELEIELGVPLFAAEMLKKRKDIFRKYYFVFRTKELKMTCIKGIAVSIISIAMFFWLGKYLLSSIMLIAAIFLLVFCLYKLLLPFVLAFIVSDRLCKMHETMELAFYHDCVIMYIGGRELETFMYEDLEEVSILPEETWLFFKKRGVVFLPEYSINAEKREIIVKELYNNIPEIKIRNKKINEK